MRAALLAAVRERQRSGTRRAAAPRCWRASAACSRSAISSSSRVSRLRQPPRHDAGPPARALQPRAEAVAERTDPAARRQGSGDAAGGRAPSPVKQIAFALGFKDTAYFSRFFRKHTGEAPGVWRRRVAARRRAGPVTAGSEFRRLAVSAVRATCRPRRRSSVARLRMSWSQSWGRFALDTFVPQQPDFDRRRGGKASSYVVTALARSNGAANGRGTMAANSESASRAGRARKCGNEHSYSRRPVAFGQGTFERGAVVHFRSPGESAFGDEASDRSLLLAAEGNDDQRHARQRHVGDPAELALSAHDQHVVIFEQQRGAEAARRIPRTRRWRRRCGRGRSARQGRSASRA